MRLVQEKESFGKDGLASHPRGRRVTESFARPKVVLVPGIEERDQSPAIDDAVFWHGSTRLIFVSLGS
jgi:hypothetical protein